MAVNNQININLNAKDNASKSLNKLKKSSSGLGASLKKMTPSLKAVGVGLAGVGLAVGVAGKKFFDLADNIETTIGKANTVFGEYFDDVQKVADETAKSMGLTKNEYLKAAAGMQDLLVPMGFAREEATKMTTDTVALSGALSEWSAGQFDATQVADILTKAMLGEREQLKALGIAISEEDVKQRMATDAANGLTFATEQQAKAVATQALIFEKSTDAQAAFAEGADSLTRKKAELSATLGNVKETIATALIPAFHNIITTIQPIIEKVAENIKLWFENEQNVKKVTNAIQGAITVFKVIFTTIGFVVDILVKLGEMLGFIAFKVVEFSQGVAASFVSLGETIGGVWEGIKETTISTFTFIGEFIDGIIESIVSTFTAAFDKIKKIFDKIIALKNKIGGAVSSAASSVSNAISGTKANGGPVTAGKSFLVGERGPEIFTPTQNGNIAANGTGGASVQINLGGVTVTDQADENRLVEKIKMSLTDDLIMNKKFGIS